nr:sugar phosphate nucleotidyltransferase [Bradyrhizobium sp. 6(2017)]
MTTDAPKKAVILAAGFGSRLRPLTDLRPKPLVEVNETPILHNALRNLEAVAWKKSQLYGLPQGRYSICLRQPLWRARNQLCRIVRVRPQAAPILFGWRATRFFPETASLSKGDVFFEEDALRYLMMSQATDVAAVAPFNESMEGSAVLLSDSGVITSFRMKQTAANLVADGPRRFKTMNLLRLSATTLRATIVPALDDLIGSGATQAYTEALLASLVERRGLRIAASRCDGLRWYEIDSTEDLPIAERIFTRAPAFDRAGLQNRRRVQRQDTFGIQKTP